jgi:hypothetical protein
MAEKTSGLTPIQNILPAILKPEMKPLTPIQERLVSMPIEAAGEESIVYQHSVLCRTCIPYRDPGEDVKIWQPKNGFIRLEVIAGRVLDPHIDEVVEVGLPFGPKPRLVLYHLNAEDRSSGWRMIRILKSVCESCSQVE